MFAPSSIPDVQMGEVWSIFWRGRIFGDLDVWLGEIARLTFTDLETDITPVCRGRISKLEGGTARRG